MMIADCIAVLALRVQSTEPALDFKSGAFYVRNGKEVERVPTNQRPPVPSKVFALKEGANWIVWDTRGLTVRTPAGSRSSFLPDIATSAKIHTASEIETIACRIQQGDIKKEASALAGYSLQNEQLYLVLRWSDAKGQPWLDALVRLDLSSKQPWPVLVAKMPGMVLTKTGAPVDLTTSKDGLLRAIATQGDAWGVESVTTKGKPQFLAYGKRLIDAKIDATGKTIAFVETSSYGSRLGGAIDCISGERTLLLESAQPLDLISADPPLFRELQGTVATLHAGDSGQTWRYPANSNFREVKDGYLLWSAGETPLRAMLLSKSLDVRAVWAHDDQGKEMMRAVSAEKSSAPKPKKTTRPR